jgi:hypothetical protein
MIRGISAVLVIFAQSRKPMEQDIAMTSDFHF